METAKQVDVVTPEIITLVHSNEQHHYPFSYIDHYELVFLFFGKVRCWRENFIILGRNINFFSSHISSVFMSLTADHQMIFKLIEQKSIDRHRI